MSIKNIWLVIAGKGQYGYGRNNIAQLTHWRREKFDFYALPVVKQLCTLIGSCIHIEPVKAHKLADELVRADIHISPQMYYAHAIFSVVFCILGALLLALAGIYILVPALLLLALDRWNGNIGKVKKKLAEKDHLISLELPRFVRSIVFGLQSDRDIVNLIAKYSIIAGVALRSDLNMLLLDMRSGNIELALRAFESRLGSYDVTRLVNALINIEQGIDQKSTLNYLADDMSVLQRENIKRELLRRPGKLKATMMPLAALSMISVLYALLYSIFSNGSLLFS